MSTKENKLLAKRAKRDIKRKTLKLRNAVAKTATTRNRKLVNGRREAISKLRDDVYDFIVQKDSFKKFLASMIDGGKALKAKDGAKYDGLILSAYEKGIAKIDELVEPRLSKLAAIVDGINVNTAIDMNISDYLNAVNAFNDLCSAFTNIVQAVNRYHNHNVSVYNATDDPEHIAEFTDDDFNFDKLSEPTDLDALLNEMPNSHEDVEATVVVDDAEPIKPEETPEPEK